MNAAVGPSPLLGQIGAKIGASSLGKPCWVCVQNTLRHAKDVKNNRQCYQVLLFVCTGWIQAITLPYSMDVKSAAASILYTGLTPYHAQLRLQDKGP